MHEHLLGVSREKVLKSHRGIEVVAIVTAVTRTPKENVCGHKSGCERTVVATLLRTRISATTQISKQFGNRPSRTDAMWR